MPTVSTARTAGLLLVLSLAFCAPVSVAAAGSQTGAPLNSAPAEGTSAGQDQSASVAGEQASLPLRPGDLIDLEVYNVPELSTKARISNRGDIYLPLINYVHVAGLTAEQTQTLLEEKLSSGGFVKDPHVTVLVAAYASQGASLLGEVGRPGVYPIVGQQRLFDVISSAGGFTEKSGRSITITHRDHPEKPIVVPLARNVSDSPDSNVFVFPGDTIVVRKADVVYVVGEVGRPSGFAMDSGHLTVLQVIALAGGTTKMAKLGSVRLLRKGPSGVSETAVPLKRILEAKVPDLPMQADDILFVPTSSVKAAASRSLDAVMQTASALSIIAVHP
jgi:polysaccharide export outer membrane protein